MLSAVMVSFSLPWKAGKSDTESFHRRWLGCSPILSSKIRLSERSERYPDGFKRLERVYRILRLLRMMKSLSPKM